MSPNIEAVVSQNTPRKESLGPDLISIDADTS